MHMTRSDESTQLNKVADSVRKLKDVLADLEHRRIHQPADELGARPDPEMLRRALKDSYNPGQFLASFAGELGRENPRHPLASLAGDLAPYGNRKWDKKQEFHVQIGDSFDQEYFVDLCKMLGLNVRGGVDSYDFHVDMKPYHNALLTDDMKGRDAAIDDAVKAVLETRDQAQAKFEKSYVKKLRSALAETTRALDKHMPQTEGERATAIDPTAVRKLRVTSRG